MRTYKFGFAAVGAVACVVGLTMVIASGSSERKADCNSSKTPPSVMTLDSYPTWIDDEAASATIDPQDFSAPNVSLVDTENLPGDFFGNRIISYQGITLIYRFDQPMIGLMGSWLESGIQNDEAAAGLNTGLETILGINVVPEDWSQLEGGIQASSIPQGIVVSGVDEQGNSLVTWYGMRSDAESTSLEFLQLSNLGTGRRVSSAVELEDELVVYDARTHSIIVMIDADDDRIFETEPSGSTIQIAAAGLSLESVSRFGVVDGKACPIDGGFDGDFGETVFQIVEYEAGEYVLNGELSDNLTPATPHAGGPPDDCRRRYDDKSGSRCSRRQDFSCQDYADRGAGNSCKSIRRFRRIRVY